jgi:hypothetical protein
VDIGSVNSSALNSVAAQQRGGVGALGEAPKEVATPLEVPPQSVGPDQGGVAAPAENQAAGQQSERQAAPPPPPPPAEQSPTYDASGRTPGGSQGGRDAPAASPGINLMA